MTIRDKIKKAIRGTSTERTVGLLTTLSLIIVFTRPQYTFKFLESIKFPFMISLLPSAVALAALASKKWTPQIKYTMAILVQGVFLMGIATNTFWAFQGVRNIFQLSLQLMIPISFYFCCGFNLRRLLTILFLCGAYIGVYVITHGGHGPGDFLGDENDACLALVVLLAPALVFLANRGPGPKKILLFPTTLLMLAGVVATLSRGGFVGLLCVGAYIIYRSKAKMMMISAILVVCIAGLPFVPSTYWKEMGTINTKESTAQDRFKLWAIARTMFYDPKNMIWGVGMYNFPWRVAEYEPDFNRSEHGRSFAGRAVHSLYFELLPELGLIGVFLVGGAVVSSMRPTGKLLNQLTTESKLLKRVGPKIQNLEIRKSSQELAKECEFATSFLLASNAAFIGMLAGGAFISVLYYPIIWMLFGVAAAGHTYARNLLKLGTEIRSEPTHVDKIEHNPMQDQHF
jgi:hypothetical protein